ncbi:MAG: hypothetical protein J6P03_00795 [Opitutales bacterium]|nr:hypothetical protein [Opitutales bacterium]
MKILWKMTKISVYLAGLLTAVFFMLLAAKSCVRPVLDSALDPQPYCRNALVNSGLPKGAQFKIEDFENIKRGKYAKILIDQESLHGADFPKAHSSVGEKFIPSDKLDEQSLEVLAFAMKSAGGKAPFTLEELKSGGFSVCISWTDYANNSVVWADTCVYRAPYFYIFERNAKAE